MSLAVSALPRALKYESLMSDMVTSECLVTVRGLLKLSTRLLSARGGDLCTFYQPSKCDVMNVLHGTSNTNIYSTINQFAIFI